MTETGRIMDQIQLDNGLTVYFEDHSKPIVLGRCQVKLLICVPMEPREAHFKGYEDPAKALREFVALAGDRILFRIEKVRNFIDQKAAAKTIEAMKEDFIKTGLGYLHSPKFAETYIRQRFEELRREELVGRLHAEAVEKAEGV